MGQTVTPLIKLLGDLSFLSWNKIKEIEDMLRLYATIDRKIARFSAKAHLGCLANCGDCCARAIVAASPAEMQPAALYLYQKGELKAVCAKIDAADERAICAFYSPTVLESGGHCRIYPFRALVCRLFGFSARINKRGRDELMICRLIKKRQPQDVVAAQAMVDRGLKTPRSMDYFMQSYTISPTQIGHATNINRAFLDAAGSIFLSSKFSHTMN